MDNFMKKIFICLLVLILGSFTLDTRSTFKPLFPEQISISPATNNFLVSFVYNEISKIKLGDLLRTDKFTTCECADYVIVSRDPLADDESDNPNEDARLLRLDLGEKILRSLVSLYVRKKIDTRQILVCHPSNDPDTIVFAPGLSEDELSQNLVLMDDEEDAMDCESAQDKYVNSNLR